MGIDLQPEFAYKFTYESKLDKNLIEHELDYVFTGIFDGAPVVNKHEVEDWKFVDVKSLRADMDQHPEQYTVWFKLIMNHAELKTI